MARPAAESASTSLCPPGRTTPTCPTSATTGFAGRGLPDVAAAADGAYTVRFSGQPVVGEGGTSAAAPLWGALIAMINQKLATIPGSTPVGYFNPLLYKMLGRSKAFKDITSGTNDAHGNLARCVHGRDRVGRVLRLGQPRREEPVARPDRRDLSTSGIAHWLTLRRLTPAGTGLSRPRPRIRRCLRESSSSSGPSKPKRRPSLGW